MPAIHAMSPRHSFAGDTLPIIVGAALVVIFGLYALGTWLLPGLTTDQLRLIATFTVAHVILNSIGAGVGILIALILTQRAAVIQATRARQVWAYSVAGAIGGASSFWYFDSSGSAFQTVWMAVAVLVFCLPVVSFCMWLRQRILRRHAPVE